MWGNLSFLPTQVHPLAFFKFLVFLVHFVLSTFCLLCNIQLSRKATSVFLYGAFSHLMLKKDFAVVYSGLWMIALFEHFENNFLLSSAFS